MRSLLQGTLSWWPPQRLSCVCRRNPSTFTAVRKRVTLARASPWGKQLKHPGSSRGHNQQSEHLNSVRPCVDSNIGEKEVHVLSFTHGPDILSPCDKKNPSRNAGISMAVWDRNLPALFHKVIQNKIKRNKISGAMSFWAKLKQRYSPLA
jgi:hypothetical protein